MIAIQDVTVVYGRTIALNRLDLELHPGITGLFGQNGSGKSTLLRLLAGLLRPHRGAVTVDGRELRTGDEGFRRMVGYAGHETGLYPHLSIAENLGLFARLYGVPESRCGDVQSLLQLTPYGDTQVGSLSAGLKRRAAVARALLHEPRLLLLDEPYANLDDDAAEALSAAVTSSSDPLRIAVIATHGAKRIKGFVDASVILQRGEVISHRVRVPEEVTT